MKRLILLPVAMLLLTLLAGCSAKFVLVVNSGHLETGDVELSRAGTTETMTPDISLPLIPLP